VTTNIIKQTVIHGDEHVWREASVHAHVSAEVT